MSARAERVQEAIRQEVSRIVQHEIKDPRLGFMTITKVELTNDLRFAKIFFSVLGEEKDKALALKGLNSAMGYIKGLLADRVKLRFTPTIVFKIDDSMEHTKQIYDLLDKLKKERKGDEEGNRGDKEI